MTLRDLKRGQVARVASITGSDPLKRRLLALGLTPGVLVELRMAAPLGDPLVVWVRGCLLSLRRRDAARVRLVGEGLR